MLTTIEYCHKVSHGNPGVQRDDLPRHDIRCLHQEHVLLRNAFEQWHLLEVDVYVV